ncbi:hypothetical protein BJI67_15545 [Acidihalobacter aeolianus]|uniref:Uncharacterized protein n=1 Tax=Acidihalobacter aeolianus TaxID=2792603 RepID=A0A1D8KBI3_9GAMM|nr:hypothetical protein BJI67_15545 [Acidihalobacter aeolianus]
MCRPKLKGPFSPRQFVDIIRSRVRDFNAKQIIGQTLKLITERLDQRRRVCGNFLFNLTGQ